MPEQKEPGAEWRPRRSFANTDQRAVRLAELLHQARKPHLTILFGSRARGDYAEGHSDVDIMLVEDPLPDSKAAEESAMAFRKAKAELYRGQDIKYDLIVRTMEEFREKSRFINTLETLALNDGYVLGDEAEYHVGPARMKKTNGHIRHAKRHSEYLEKSECSSDDDYEGGQAYLAVQHALMAAVNAAGEWYPNIHDIEMLLELARQADPEGHYTTVLDPEIYTQYGDSRRDIPPDTPFTSQPEHRDRAIQDVQAALTCAEQLKVSWPLRRR